MLIVIESLNALLNGTRSSHALLSDVLVKVLLKRITLYLLPLCVVFALRRAFSNCS